MKNLAFMENRKLVRHLDCQRRVTRNIVAIAVDFLAFYPAAFPPVKHAQNVHLLIGSERGFCGDFNETLLHQTETRLKSEGVDSPLLIAVGHKLSTKLSEDTRLATFIDGPNVTDDIPGVLNQVTIRVETLRKQYGVVNHIGYMIAVLARYFSVDDWSFWADVTENVFDQLKADVSPQLWQQERDAIMAAPWIIKTSTRMLLLGSDRDTYAPFENPMKSALEYRRISNRTAS